MEAGVIGGASCLVLQPVQQAEEQPCRQRRRPGFPGPQARRHRHRVRRQRRQGDAEAVADVGCRPADDVVGLTGRSEPVGVLVRLVARSVPCRQVVAGADRTP
jgi:hypothetical protein